MATFPKESLRSSEAIFHTSASSMNWTKTSGSIKISIQSIKCTCFCPFVKVYSAVKVPSFLFLYFLPTGILKLVEMRWLSTSAKQPPYRTARWALFTHLHRQAASSLHFVGTALAWWVLALFRAQPFIFISNLLTTRRWDEISSLLRRWETGIQICIYLCI